MDVSAAVNSLFDPPIAIAIISMAGSFTWTWAGELAKWRPPEDVLKGLA